MIPAAPGDEEREAKEDDDEDKDKAAFPLPPPLPPPPPFAPSSTFILAMNFLASATGWDAGHRTAPRLSTPGSAQGPETTTSHESPATAVVVSEGEEDGDEEDEPVVPSPFPPPRTTTLTTLPVPAAPPGGTATTFIPAQRAPASTLPETRTHACPPRAGRGETSTAGRRSGESRSRLGGERDPSAESSVG